jgi:enoyl-CoA hydratase/carnithine racemase
MVERHDGAFDIRLNRPELLNAVDRETIAALAAAAADATGDHNASGGAAAR